MARKLNNMKNIIRRVNTIKWMVSEDVRSRINGLLGRIGLFLTDNNRLSAVVASTDWLDARQIEDIIGLTADDIADDAYYGATARKYSGTVMRDIITGNLWIYRGWDLTASK